MEPEQLITAKHLTFSAPVRRTRRSGFVLPSGNHCALLRGELSQQSTPKTRRQFSSTRDPSGRRRIRRKEQLCLQPRRCWGCFGRSYPPCLSARCEPPSAHPAVHHSDRWIDRFRFITAPFKRLKHRAPVCFCVGATSRLLIELMGYVSWSGSADCAPQQDIYKIVSAAFRRPARPFCQSLGRWCYILL